MKDLTNIISGHPLLETMTKEHLKVLVQCGREEAFKAGTILFREGEIADRFFLILEGKVAVESHEPGAADRLVQLLEAGDALGWSWLFPPYEWHFQARAVEPTRAVVFNAAHLLVACEKDHDLGYDLMKRMAQVVIRRLQATRRQLLATKPAG